MIRKSTLFLLILICLSCSKDNSIEITISSFSASEPISNVPIDIEKRLDGEEAGSVTKIYTNKNGVALVKKTFNKSPIRIDLSEFLFSDSIFIDGSHSFVVDRSEGPYSFKYLVYDLAPTEIAFVFQGDTVGGLQEIKAQMSHSNAVEFFSSNTINLMSKYDTSKGKLNLMLLEGEVRIKGRIEFSNKIKFFDESFVLASFRDTKINKIQIELQ